MATKRNCYHPYILRPLGMSVIVAIILLQPVIYNLTTTHRFRFIDYATNISASDLLSLTNQQRQAVGAANLQENSQLDQAAQAKATDMFAKDYWAHNSPIGATPWDFISNSGYRYSAAAENLAMSFSTSSGVIDGWMASGEHRTNMLNTAYVDVGFAVMNGTLIGQQTTLVVAMYAAPLKTQPAPAAAAVHPPSTATPVVNKAAPAPSPPSPSVPTPSSNPTVAPVSAAPPTAPTHPPVQSTPTQITQKPVNMSLIARLQHLDALNWGQRASVFLLSVLILIQALKHTVVWRKQKRGWRHIWLRSHPIFQASLLSIILIVVIMNSFGTII